jgi:hypothetical protein
MITRIRSEASMNPRHALSSPGVGDRRARGVVDSFTLTSVN